MLQLSWTTIVMLIFGHYQLNTKIEVLLYYPEMCQLIHSEMANSADLDQTAPIGAV